MTWTPPTFTPGVSWQDLPSVATPLDAANLNLDESTEATYTVAVANSLLAYLQPQITSGTGLSATYYVAAGGSDSNNGLSTGAPWATVSKVNAATLHPGDQVLFHGGDTFGTTVLAPAASGTDGAQITYGSYGTGNAILTRGPLWYDQHWLTFEGLTFQMPAESFQAGNNSGHFAHHIILRRCVLDGAATSSTGVLGINGYGDDWLVEECVIQNTGDTGIYVVGDGWRVHRNTITGTGQNTTLGFGRHGIYAHAGSNLSIHHNHISNWGANGQAISARYHNTDIVGNTIDGPNNSSNIGIAYFTDENVAGYTRIVANTVRGCAGGGQPCIYVPASDIFSLTETIEIGRNTLLPMVGGIAADLRQGSNPYKLGAGVDYAQANPSFEAGTASWTTASSWFLTTGATLTQVATPLYTDGGAHSGKVVTTSGSASQGAELACGTPAAGTYLAEVWVQGNSGGEAVTLWAGPHTASAKNRNFTLTTSYQQLVLPFLADGTSAMFVGVATQSAQALTWFLDNVHVWPASV